MKTNIDFANLNRQYLRYKDEIDAAMQQVVDSSHFIMGPEPARLPDGKSTERSRENPGKVDTAIEA
jgi:hypothetical protein